ncbi:MAG: hypothetical protein KAH32_03695 [Chlamydiia bacterium]|nr:hypothetical protein [Chlamydiia bacterium]
MLISLVLCFEVFTYAMSFGYKLYVRNECIELVHQKFSDSKFNMVKNSYLDKIGQFEFAHASIEDINDFYNITSKISLDKSNTHRDRSLELLIQRPSTGNSLLDKYKSCLTCARRALGYSR